MITTLDEKYVVDRIRQLWIEDGRDLVKFSGRVGISKETLKNYVSGANRPRLSKLILIAKGCKVSLDWLCSRPE